MTGNGRLVAPLLGMTGERPVAPLLGRQKGPAILEFYFSIIQRYAYWSAATRAVCLLTAPLPCPPSVFSK